MKLADVFRLVVGLAVALAITGCHTTQSTNGATSASAPASSSPPRSPTAQTAASKTELTIDATGFVTRMSDGTIVLDAPPVLDKRERRTSVNQKYTHYELPPKGEATKLLDDALTKEKVNELPFLPYLLPTADLTNVHVARVMFSTRNCEATRLSPIVATVRARVKRVEEQQHSADPHLKFGGTTFLLDEPIRVMVVLRPDEMMKVAEQYRSSIRRAASTVPFASRDLDRAFEQLVEARAALHESLGDASSGYEAFRFVDDLLRDLKRGIASRDPLDLAPALREHMVEEAFMDDVERPYLIDAERELIQKLDEWIHNQAAAAFAEEKGATARAKALGALIIKADNLKLGPRSAHDYMVPPRIVSTAAKTAHRRFPELDPHQK
jgi:hypothetical protein